jgi:glycine/D-amino acid oxidase-like deaminating enzyme
VKLHFNLSPVTTFDYIIIGQGLAGSCLSLHLLEQNKKLLVIDRIDPNSATRVAAGLFNPITGKNLTKTWMADALFGYLHQFYAGAEQRTQKKFLHQMPLYRPFVSIEEQNSWMGKSADREFANYIDTIYTTPFNAHHVHNALGGMLLQQCGYLNTTVFCEAVRELIHENVTLLNEDFTEADLILESDAVAYKKYWAKKIIFCQGEEVRKTKLFSWLPIQPLKGQTLTIETTADVRFIANRGVYVVPGIWKVGATYEFHDQTRTTTQNGLNELRNKLDELVCFPYKIIDQSWGMRPTSPDRRPILGAHPMYNSAVLFNGLGTKGVSLAPYFSKVLAEWLEKNTPINKEVDIHRYKQYYYAGNLSR